MQDARLSERFPGAWVMASFDYSPASPLQGPWAQSTLDPMVRSPQLPWREVRGRGPYQPSVTCPSSHLGTAAALPIPRIYPLLSYPCLVSYPCLNLESFQDSWDGEIWMAGEEPDTQLDFPGL